MNERQNELTTEWFIYVDHPHLQAILRESISNGCKKGFAALSSPDIKDASLLDQVVWGYPLILNEHVRTITIKI